MRPVLVLVLTGSLLWQGGCAHNREAIASADPVACPAVPDETLGKYSWSDNWLENHPILKFWVDLGVGTAGGAFLGVCGLTLLVLAWCADSADSAFSPFTR